MSIDSPPRVVTGLTGSWTIDPAHTRMGFVARHAMVSKVRGSFNQFDGTAVVGSGEPGEARIDVTIQAGTVDTRNADRDAHLRSSDFLDVDRYPTITFSSTSVTAHGQSLEVVGDLTIKGVTRAVTIPFAFLGTVVDPYGCLRAGFEGSVVINRRDFGVSWNALMEAGGVVVGDMVTLEFEVAAIRQAD